MTTHNLQQACELLRKSPNTLKSWFKRGCPVQQFGSQNKPWKIVVADVVTWREEQAVINAISELPDDQEELKLRKLKAETTIVEIEAAKKRNEVAPLVEVESMVRELCIEIRSNILLIPQRVASQDPILKNALTEEIRLVLHELTNIDIGSD